MPYVCSVLFRFLAHSLTTFGRRVCGERWRLSLIYSSHQTKAFCQSVHHPLMPFPTGLTRTSPVHLQHSVQSR
ncbi:hypothetical protein C9022_22085, partial [Escherichia coli]